MNPPPIYDEDDDDARERHDAINPYMRGLEIEAAGRPPAPSRRRWPARLAAALLLSAMLLIAALLYWWLA